MSSFGFITRQSNKTVVTSSDTTLSSINLTQQSENGKKNCTKYSIFKYFFILLLSIGELCFIQFSLKTEHQHPHIPHEKDLQHWNIYFNIIVVYLSLNTLWYPLIHLTQNLQKYQMRIHFAYCILWGVAAGMILPIELSSIETSRLNLIHLYISLFILLIVNLY